MKSITVESLAKKAGLTTTDLLKKISEAGLCMSKEDDILNIEQQQKVIEHIRKNKRKMMTLRRESFRNALYVLITRSRAWCGLCHRHLNS